MKSSALKTMMSIPDRIKSVGLALWEVWKGRRIFATDSDFWSSFLGGGNIAHRPVTVPSVLQLSAASACVRLISETLSTLPVRLLRKGANGMNAPALDHNLYMLLHSRPNARMTAAVFWCAFIASLLLRGNAYVEKKLSASFITSLEFLHPDAVTRKRSDSGQVEWEYIDPETGVRRTIPASRMWHCPAFSLDGVTGLSPISYGANVFGTAAATEEASADTFRNGMKSPGVLAAAGFGTLREEQRRALKAEILRASDAGEPLILEKDTTWQSLTLSPQDAQLLASRAWSVEEICRFFGVPPFMVGHSEKSTTWGSGIEQQQIGFVAFVLRRWSVRIEQSIWKDLLTPIEQISYSAEFALEGLLRGDSAARATYYQSMLNNGIYTTDEVRRLENLPPMGGNAEKLRVQGAMVLLDSLTEDGADPASVAKSTLQRWLESEQS